MNIVWSKRRKIVVTKLLETLIMLAILVLGCGVLFVLYRWDCKKASRRGRERHE